MATLTAGGTTSSPQSKDKINVQVNAPSRREFLYYIWGASMALLLGGGGAAFIWYALPRFAEGTFGGLFNFAPTQIPQAETAPTSVPSGRFWVSNTNSGLVVLFGVCTHLGCLPKWVPANFRFECPCHGSKFELDGTYIEGPAPRALDRFPTTITFADGTVETSNDIGDPIPLNGREIASIVIDTGKKLVRPGHN